MSVKVGQNLSEGAGQRECTSWARNRSIQGKTNELRSSLKVLVLFITDIPSDSRRMILRRQRADCSLIRIFWVLRLHCNGSTSQRIDCMEMGSNLSHECVADDLGATIRSNP